MTSLIEGEEFKPDRGDTLDLAAGYMVRSGRSASALVSVAQRMLDWQSGKDERATSALRVVLGVAFVAELETVLAEADKVYGWLQGNSDGD